MGADAVAIVNVNNVETVVGIPAKGKIVMTRNSSVGVY